MNLKTILALLLVLALVLITNLLDNKSFEIVKRSLSNIYEDRLVAYDLTYKIHEEVVNRKLTLIQHSEDLPLESKEFYQKVDEMLVEYEATHLTVKEADYLEKLEDKLEDLKKLEVSFAAEDNSLDYKKSLKRELLNKTEGIINNLNVLAQIQVDEGKRQKIYSDRAIESGTFMARIKIICIIIVGLGIQFLLFYTPPKTK